MYIIVVLHFFFFKQKTAYEMRISDWSSDVCSSDLLERRVLVAQSAQQRPFRHGQQLGRLELARLAIRQLPDQRITHLARKAPAEAIGEMFRRHLVEQHRQFLVGRWHRPPQLRRAKQDAVHRLTEAQWAVDRKSTRLNSSN